MSHDCNRAESFVKSYVVIAILERGNIFDNYTAFDDNSDLYGSNIIDFWCFYKHFCIQNKANVNLPEP